MKGEAVVEGAVGEGFRYLVSVRKVRVVNGKRYVVEIESVCMRTLGY